MGCKVKSAGFSNWIRYLTGFFAETGNCIVKTAGRYPMFITPCSICQATLSAFGDQFHPFVQGTSWSTFITHNETSKYSKFLSPIKRSVVKSICYHYEFKNVDSKATQDLSAYLKFDIDTVKVENITEFKEYHGLHVAVIGYLDRTRIPIEIDIGFGDSVYPDAVKMDFPVILDMEIPKITVYSLESAIAEKMEAIISNGYLNSRYKDFYDIYVLSEKYVFEYLKLKKALLETFNNRKTSMTIESAVFSEDFINDPIHQVRWKAFLKKKKAIISISLYEVIDRIKAFYYPLIEEKKNIECIWSPKEGCWTSYDGSC